MSEKGYFNGRIPGPLLSLLPIALLLISISFIIISRGADAVQQWSYLILLACAGVALSIHVLRKGNLGNVAKGIVKSAVQILPTVPILIGIGTMSATWMISGVVPLFINVGLEFLNPEMFLFVACLACALISVMTGSSWTTIATVGVAMMGVGTVMGFSAGWIAGAVISGAYFGDKVSPLSDTTVLASSTCGVPLFKHISFLMRTSAPAITISLLIFITAGLAGKGMDHSEHVLDMTTALNRYFNLSPWLLLIPGFTMTLIAFRVGTAKIMFASTLAGLAGAWIFQPQIMDLICGEDGSMVNALHQSIGVLLTGTELGTGNELLDNLVLTGGAYGMLPTIMLVLSAMTFGGVMMGTGMLASLTSAITSRLKHPRKLVMSTVASGLFLNSCTGDQYLSIIVGANVYGGAYERSGLSRRHLSRTLEDSISVTSVLIPWNSCGVTQSTVLGVATFTYLPFCFFNILSPCCTLLWVMFRRYVFKPLHC